MIEATTGTISTDVADIPVPAESNHIEDARIQHRFAAAIGNCEFQVASRFLHDFFEEWHWHVYGIEMHKFPWTHGTEQVALASGFQQNVFGAAANNRAPGNVAPQDGGPIPQQGLLPSDCRILKDHLETLYSDDVRGTRVMYSSWVAASLPASRQRKARPQPT
jgi:hypothetical protein